jgi:hypothetical protein
MPSHVSLLGCPMGAPCKCAEMGLDMGVEMLTIGFVNFIRFFGEASAYLSELDASGCLTHPFHRQLDASEVWERT